MGKKLNFLALSLLTLLALLGGAFTKHSADWQDVAKANPGDVAWMIVASAFVLLITPRLAFFYGGMVDRKNVISTMLQSFVALGVSASSGWWAASACASGTASAASSATH